ncbi:acyltransferase [Halomonas sp. 7T]|uniref:acyltransferase family protein n=1 Tax=Halomonas sp. 7T TaxID=2893469 RepID=UPI0021D9676F|nr:acyltransferase family protein [Halomonas sp. 7T]UXZ55436.1 acyltransferase [Halomonas sp. 7T]
MTKTFDIYARDNSYRYDIQGIRAIGAMLVLIFHIWFQKVSGGVDVFFVVSGYLMTGILLRQYAKDEKLKILQFWANIVKRVTPSAYVVLVSTLLLSYFFISPVYWIATIHEFILSAGHLENILLMRREVDYLQSGDPASPFQQYWALSIQIQFYAFLPFLMVPLLYISSKMKSLTPLISGVFAVISASFIYSVFSTIVAPSTAYFNPLGRVWEFLAGSMVAVILPHLKLSKDLSVIFSLVGFVVLISVGVVIPRGWNFPGYIALLPVFAAIFLIVSGSAIEHKSIVNSLLTNKYLVMLGAMSFTIYLWHWPVLVFFQNYYETVDLGFMKGTIVIFLGIILAVITTSLIERPFRKIPKNKTWLAFATGLVFFIPSVALGLSVKYYFENLYDVDPVFNKRFFYEAGVYIQDDATELDYRYVTAVSKDLSEAMEKENNCATQASDSDIILCEFGDTNAENIIALVGGSHVGQWEPFFTSLAEQHGFKLVTILKHSCSLGYKIVENNPTCDDWNAGIVDYLSNINPAVVVTNSTRSNRFRKNRLVRNDPTEYVPAGYVQKWQEITALGIPVIGIRDNPWFENDPSYCVWKNREDASQCARPVEEVLLQTNPAEEYVGEIPLFISVDFTEMICDEGLCPAYFDGRLMWSDTHHLTRTYLEYVTPSLKELLQRQTSFFQNFGD